MYPKLGLFIDGGWRYSAESDEAVINPATGQPIGRLPHAALSDLDDALGAADRGFALWKVRPALERSIIMRKAAALMRDRVDSIARVLTMEQGKPLDESVGEVLVSANIIDWYAEEGRRAYGRVIPSPVAGLRLMVIPEPVGPVAGFSPWNFPALTPARKIGAALGSGCSIILKAAEQTPGTAVEMTRAFQDAGLPAGVLNLVFGVPGDVSAHLIASPVIRKISFTGSTPVGKQLMAAAIPHLKRVTMELGGHAPVIVCDDADAERTAQMLARAKFRNAGQVCISPTRFYVQENIIEDFTRRFVEEARGLKVGDGLAVGTQLGPLASERRVSAMERLTEDAVTRGAQLLCGGVRHGGAGSFFEATVVTEVPQEADIMVEEPFGPLVPIVAFRHLEDAINSANATPYGLSAYAFTQSIRNSAILSAEIKAGMIGINSLAISHPEAPFGGVKESGSGQEGGTEGLQAYLETKLVAHGE